MNNKLFLISILFATLLISPAFASKNLDKIVITGTKTEHDLDNAPVKTIVIKTDDLIKKGVLNLEDAFRHISGIKVNKNSGSWGEKGQIVLRGFDPKHTLILVDGHRLSGGHSASIDINSYPIEMIEKIEIVKGPGSVLYGSEAMAGVINIITKSATEKSSGDVTLFAGSRDTQNYVAGAGFKGEKLGTYLTYSYKHTDGVEEKLDEVSIHRASASFDYDLSNRSSFYTKLLFTNEKMEEDERTQKRIGVNPGIIINPDSVSKLKLFGSYFTYDHETEDKTTDYTQDLIEAEINYSRLMFTRHNFTLGSQFEKAEREDNGKDFDADETTKSIFISDEIDFSPFVAVLGVRLDSHEEWGEEYNPKASFMYKLGSKLTLRTSLGKGFNAPSLSKLYGNWKMGPYNTLANKDLKPERSIGFDAGLDYNFSNNFKTSFSFFKSFVKDLIISKKYKLDGKRYIEWENIDEVTILGAELDSEILLKDFSSKTSYTWMLTENDNTGNELEERPRHKLDLNFAYNLRSFGTKFDIFCTWIGDRYEDDTNDTKLDSYWIFDASISKTISKNISLFVRAENIFGKEGVEDEYDIDGRLYFAGFKGRF